MTLGGRYLHQDDARRRVGDIRLAVYRLDNHAPLRMVDHVRETLNPLLEMLTYR